jgi:hypothetical protein
MNAQITEPSIPKPPIPEAPPTPKQRPNPKPKPDPGMPPPDQEPGSARRVAPRKSRHVPPFAVAARVGERSFNTLLRMDDNDVSILSLRRVPRACADRLAAPCAREAATRGQVIPVMD